MVDEIKTMPHLYLDMDGVQADFFGAWALRHGVSNYKDIPDLEVAIDELASISYNEVLKFFIELQPLQGGIEIVTWLKDNNIPYTVLSAPLRGPYADASIVGKKYWLDQFNPDTSENAIFTQHKHKYALTDGEPNVLVDDYGKYIDYWTEAGGIAVKHEDENTNLTIETLEKIYVPYLTR
jgi:hypothetical protein